MTARWLFSSLHGYRLAWLPSDAVAGLMLVAIVLPGQLATARLAGMPPETGLVAFVVASIAFAALGANRFLSVGADSTIAPIFGGVLLSLSPGDPQQHAALAAALALMVGAILAGAGVLRAGWMADLLSTPVITGFLAGIAVHIVVSQLPGALGVAPSEGHVLAQLMDVVRRVPDANPYAVAISVVVLALTLVAHWIGPKIPGALLGVGLATIACWWLGLAAHGVETLGALAAIVPRPTLPLVALEDVARMLPLAITVALVCMAQTAAVARSFPSDANSPENLSQDFLGVGAGSLLAGMTGAFAVDASPPSTAVVAQAGGRSQLAQLIAVASILLLAAVAGGAATYLPQAALAAVLIYIALLIVRVGDLVDIARRSQGEIVLAAAASALVVLLPIERGVGLAIVLSLVHSTWLLARPRCARLARLAGTTIWWPPTPGEQSETMPGVLVFAPAAPLTFINANYIRAELEKAIADESGLRLVVIEASGITLIDYTGARAMIAVIGQLRADGVDVAMARLEADRAAASVQRSRLLQTLGADHLFHSVEEAVTALARRTTVNMACKAVPSGRQ